jgi:hypothetical protein
VFPAGASLVGFGRDGAVYVSVKRDEGRRTVGRLTVR